MFASHCAKAFKSNTGHVQCVHGMNDPFQEKRPVFAYFLIFWLHPPPLTLSLTHTHILFHASSVDGFYFGEYFWPPTIPGGKLVRGTLQAGKGGSHEHTQKRNTFSFYCKARNQNNCWIANIYPGSVLSLQANKKNIWISAKGDVKK